MSRLAEVLGFFSLGRRQPLPGAADEDKLVEHKQYIDKNGQDLPEIRNWVWGTSP